MKSQNPELERVKNDLETMQKALGIVPSMGRAWVQWMKRDRWFSLWWCLPGGILIAAALLPINHATRYWGLVSDQWAGILVAAVMLVFVVVHDRRVRARDGRPEGLIREAKRINGLTAEGFWFALALLVELFVYFVWGKEYRIAFEPFWAGLFILVGSSCLTAAIAARAWILLGWAVPFLAYGFCLPFAGGHGKVNGVLFGLMFIAVALSFSCIAAVQLKIFERQNDAD